MGQLNRIGHPLHLKNIGDSSTITNKESKVVNVERNRLYTRFVFYVRHAWVSPVDQSVAER